MLTSSVFIVNLFLHTECKIFLDKFRVLDILYKDSRNGRLFYMEGKYGIKKGKPRSNGIGLHRLQPTELRYAKKQEK
jgi:hypothetical protein